MSAIKSLMAFVGLWPEEEQKEKFSYLLDELDTDNNASESDDVKEVDSSDSQPLAKEKQVSATVAREKKSIKQPVIEKKKSGTASASSVQTLTPKSFGDAKELADEFSGGFPVIMSLQGLDKPLARRLIDFASGICYALDGSMEKIAPQVFLLTPATIVLTDKERNDIFTRS